MDGIETMSRLAIAHPSDVADLPPTSDVKNALLPL